jgi:molybdopterin-guanine dinucleotide biosynthesis protein A
MQSKAGPVNESAASVVGVVIAGGRSRRFGAEKAVAELGGRPLLLWAAERLARCCSRVAVNTRPGTGAESLAHALQLTVLTDAAGDPDGPLSGVKAGLLWAREQGATHLAVSPCDVPLAPDDLYPRLLAAAGEGAALAETSEGRQPMCAVWPVSALPAIVSALASGEHPPTWRMLEEAGAQKVLFASHSRFANLNTREDLARFEALLAAGTYQR